MRKSTVLPAVVGNSIGKVSTPGSRSNRDLRNVPPDREMELIRMKSGLAQGITVCGPHRDDLQMLLDDMDAGMFASRGECRTVTLAMKLAEAGYLKEHRGQEPILLLDDVLSELDAARRALVLDRASQYQQCFITTTDVEPIEEKYLSQMSRFVVRGGRVSPVVGGGSGGN